MRKYVVKDGDTLAAIALRELGDETQWVTLYQINRQSMGEAQRRLFPEHDKRSRNTPSPDWIFPGQILMLPGEEPAENSTAGTPAGTP